MKIHEYQAKAILAKYGVPVPRGEVAFTVDEAEAAAKKIGGSVVVKAQIHAGGRGKGGGVKVAKDAAEAVEIAKKMLGMRLVTHQTGPGGPHRAAPAGGRNAADRSASCISASCWIARKASRCSWRRRRAGWRSKRWRRNRPS